MSLIKLDFAKAKPTRSVVIRTADELERLKLPEPKEIVNGILQVGVNLFGARPKIGKSWFALELSLAIAQGGDALGKIRVQPGEVLYLALEDTERRMQSRLKRFGRFPERLHLAYEWPRLDQGGLEALSDFLDQHPETRLVVIDVWKKVRPRRIRGAQLYDEDYEHMAVLRDLAQRYEIAILAIHHTRKSEAEDVLDEISGSTGLTGAADAVLILHRSRTEADAEMWITGKDIQEQHLGLRFEDGYQWRSMGLTVTLTRSSAAREIRDAVTTVMANDGKRNAGVTPADVARVLGKKLETVRQRMFQMAKRGELKRVANSKYVVT